MKYINYLKIAVQITQENITGAPWYVASQVLHEDLEVPTVKL